VFKCQTDASLTILGPFLLFATMIYFIEIKMVMLVQIE